MSRVLLLLVGGLFACSSSGLPERSGAAPAAVPAPRATIGKLQMRDRSILLLASGAGLRVTVEDMAGTVLAEDVALDDLRTIDPVAYDVCRSSTASHQEQFDARLQLPLDSRVDDR
jgi:hypothetical protein